VRGRAPSAGRRLKSYLMEMRGAHCVCLLLCSRTVTAKPISFLHLPLAFAMIPSHKVKTKRIVREH
jgi:hypothetical protein